MIILWHPNSPGVKVLVRKCWLRRMGIVRSPFATLGEMKDHVCVSGLPWL